MIEKYLKDSIVEDDRKKLVEELSNRNLIPKRMKLEMARLDSIKKAKVNELIAQKLQQDNDTTSEIEEDSLVAQKIIPQQNDLPGKDGQKSKQDTNNAVLTTDERRNINKKRNN